MKKIFVLIFAVSFTLVNANAQKLGKFLKDVTKKDSASGASVLDKVTGAVSGGSISGLSTNEIAQGLKEALSKGAEQGSNKLSALNGFFGNAAIKILLPDEAKKVEAKLRSIGLGKQVDEAILSLNRAAEDAAKSAAPIFINAVKEMSFDDALNILKGNDTAATAYLQGKTTKALSTAFTPVIENSLEKVDATKYWNALFTTYNKLPLVSKVNPNLTEYVTEKALFGVFTQIADEEKNIRDNPLARTSDILKKVFGANK
ncbi:DUF4197 domain-containing protein [Polluticaenibacter yanchengensis]|uniref:DUF4197 domain-containing protein n=1 Tax=Polluticaenibacter yanchengensis TaxID=3014562 RepID=A0ABT4UI64_9BACT|nr:DUF4197 domain-containing protein [Chitinophagaceae bacterium LY-5]